MPIRYNFVPAAGTRRPTRARQRVLAGFTLDRQCRAAEGLPSPTNNLAAPEAGAAVLEWRVHLARAEPGRAAVVVLVLAAACALAYVVFRHPLAVLLSAAALLSAVSEFLFPIVYRLDGEGVRRRNGLGYSVLAWKDVKRCYADGDGIKLSPLPRPSRLEGFRGVALRYPADAATRERLLNVLQARCPQAAPSDFREEPNRNG